MALVAPLDQVEGGIDGLLLEAGVGRGGSQGGHGNNSVVVPGTSGSVGREGGYGWLFGLLVGMVMLFAWL